MTATLPVATKKKIIYVKNATWWEYDGEMEDAKKIHNSCRHQYYEGSLGPQCLQSQKRPGNFLHLDCDEQWAIDKRLGVLDWDGEPNT